MDSNGQVSPAVSVRLLTTRHVLNFHIVKVAFRQCPVYYLAIATQIKSKKVGIKGRVINPECRLTGHNHTSHFIFLYYPLFRYW